MVLLCNNYIYGLLHQQQKQLKKKANMSETQKEPPLSAAVRNYQKRELEIAAELARNQARTNAIIKVIIILGVIAAMIFMHYKNKGEDKVKPHIEGPGIFNKDSILAALKHLGIAGIVFLLYYIVRKKNEAEEEQQQDAAQ
eukprot:TRINITY_DN1819_c0_g1_i1.p11 TRINITY_DN1819_c0_g1~~TRINITY_DN1819_c0_g1_i1.p11  ORF type:complete len:141 (+),score=21.52 TRINITY_DN1819_c0_g1_i1:2773-3195(+)